MGKLLRWVGYGLGALLLVALAGALYIWVASERIAGRKLEGHPSRLAAPTARQLADAPRQLRVLGCLGCHGDRLQGENFFNDPKLALLYAPNLTLVAAKATDAQLDRAIRQGIGHDGRPLFVMPSEGYQFLTDQEVAAVIAAVRAQPRGGSEQPLAKLGPLGRIGLATGKFHTIPELVEQYRVAQLPVLAGAKLASGRHIVEVNCSECHGADLKGKELEPGVVSADLSIVGAYDAEQFKRLMREGRAPSGKDIGLMGRIARSDFRHLNDEEIAAVHAYLQALAQR